LTYTGEHSQHHHITVQISSAASATDTFLFRIAVNGETVTKTEARRKVTNNDVGNCSLTALLDLNTSDTIEIHASRLGASANIIVETMTVAVHGIS
jgi:hypothetical protein